MAAYFNLLTVRNQPVEAIFAATDVAEENRLIECAAATKIQSVARMRRGRVRYLHVRNCIVSMQRTYRGYMSRRRFLDIVCHARLSHQRAVYDHFATSIQRVFRGFYSRKWRSDYYSQKRYLQMVEARSQAVRHEAEQCRSQQEADTRVEFATIQRQEFQAAASGLHHLLSTAVRSGVLRPAAATTGLSTVFGTNVEDELRDAITSVPRRKFRGEWQTQRTADAGTTHLSVPGNGIGKTKYVPSLQASEPYDAEREQAKIARAVDAKLAAEFHRHSFVGRKVGARPTLDSRAAEHGGSR